MNFGIVVEDDRDGAAYQELIKKIRQDVEHVVPFPCHGVSTLKKVFIKGLKYFRYHSQYSIDKAMVIRDSDCSDAPALENDLEQVYVASKLQTGFSVRFHATKCELETWLLVDENAINQAALRRGKRGRLGALKIQFESYAHAKELFVERLIETGLPDTPQVYQEIALFTDIKRIKAHCPHFQSFTAKVQSP
jgi:hypothetical protein